jgi:hypothetical protein
VTTAPWTYLRLRRPGYAAPELAAWLAQIRGGGADQAFVFFKHEDAGAGPRLAAELLALAHPAPLRAGAAAARELAAGSSEQARPVKRGGAPRA